MKINLINIFRDTLVQQRMLLLDIYDIFQTNYDSLLVFAGRNEAYTVNITSQGMNIYIKANFLVNFPILCGYTFDENPSIALQIVKAVAHLNQDFHIDSQFEYQITNRLKYTRN